MARYVRFTSNDDQTVYVNPEHVLMIEQAGDSTILHLAGMRASRGLVGNNNPLTPLVIWVKGNLEDVVPQLGEAG